MGNGSTLSVAFEGISMWVSLIVKYCTIVSELSMVHLVMVPILWLLSSKKMARCPVTKGLTES